MENSPYYPELAKRRYEEWLNKQEEGKRKKFAAEMMEIEKKLGLKKSGQKIWEYIASNPSAIQEGGSLWDDPFFKKLNEEINHGTDELFNDIARLLSPP